MYSPLSYVRGPQSIPVVICQGSRSLKNKEVVYYNPDINYRGQFGLEPITGDFGSIDLFGNVDLIAAILEALIYLSSTAITSTN